jgi:hypothetical protein
VQTCGGVPAVIQHAMAATMSATVPSRNATSVDVARVHVALALVGTLLVCAAADASLAAVVGASRVRGYLSVSAPARSLRSCRDDIPGVCLLDFACAASSQAMPCAAAHRTCCCTRSR